MNKQTTRRPEQTRKLRHRKKTRKERTLQKTD